jgi:tetratricopeptide (TPR) repeat protein
MVHRTRKRLTKTELKRDPVAENLQKAWEFGRAHLKGLVIALAVVAVGIVALQAAFRTSRSQNDDAMARYLFADMLYEQAEQSALSGQTQQASGLLTQAYSLSTSTYEQNQNRIWGRRSAILAAKTGILLGRSEEVISLLQQLLGSRPQQEIAVTALLHLSIATENRGGPQDLVVARDGYTRLLADSSDYPMVAAEAMSGLARLSLQDRDYPSAQEWLDRSLALKADTTDFDRYMLAQLEQQAR